MVIVTLNVDIVVCAVEIIAEPGDQLMFANGMCLGVYTKKENDPIPETPIEPLNNESIIGVMTHVPTNIMDICDALNIPRKKSTIRAQVGARIERLHRSGLIQMEPRPEGKKKHFGKYYLARES